MSMIRGFQGPGRFPFLIMALWLAPSAFEHVRPTIAVLNVDTKGMLQDPKTMGNLVRMEMEKTSAYSVLDPYEVADALAKVHVSIDSCFSKSCVVEIGRRLGADKMLTGTAERMGEKIVITLRLLDVSSATIEKTDVTEYQNLPEVQKMARISVEKIAGLQPDPTLASVLVDYDTPIENPNNSFTNNGPRVAVTYTMPGPVARRFQGSSSNGGYDEGPLDVAMGWQQELAYYSAGPFQALVEFVPAVGGFTYGNFVPSLTILQGFRLGNLGLEFALGPTFRLLRMADGYYYPDGGNDANWHDGSPCAALPSPACQAVPTFDLPDSRGDFELKTSLFLAAGITLHSGYLNLPLNVFLVPRKAGEGTTWGFSLGFNVTHKRKIEE